MNHLNYLYSMVSDIGRYGVLLALKTPVNYNVSCSSACSGTHSQIYGFHPSFTKSFDKSYQ